MIDKTTRTIILLLSLYSTITKTLKKDIDFHLNLGEKWREAAKLVPNSQAASLKNTSSWDPTSRANLISSKFIRELKFDFPSL